MDFLFFLGGEGGGESFFPHFILIRVSIALRAKKYVYHAKKKINSDPVACGFFMSS